jgi:DNA-binding response OmpR family regulator
MLRRRALVVEDDEDLRRVLRLALTFEGFDVVQATDGLEALRLIEKASPDIILLDLGLPGVSGHDVLSELSLRADLRIPIVVVTASRERLDHLSVECVLRKPVKLDELIQTVRRCLARAPHPPTAETS